MMTTNHSILSLVLALLVVAMSTTATNAQRLRGVLKRPLPAEITNSDGSIGKSSLLRVDSSQTNANDNADLTTALMNKMTIFDELIWEMAANTVNNNDNDDEDEDSIFDDANQQRRLRWRKTISTNDENDEKDESTEGPSGPWGSCVDKDAIICMDHIKLLNESLNVVILPYGSIVTMDFRTDRVRIFVDEENKVKITPRIG